MDKNMKETKLPDVPAWLAEHREENVYDGVLLVLVLRGSSRASVCKRDYFGFESPESARLALQRIQQDAQASVRYEQALFFSLPIPQDNLTYIFTPEQVKKRAEDNLRKEQERAERERREHKEMEYRQAKALAQQAQKVREAEALVTAYESQGKS